MRMVAVAVCLCFLLVGCSGNVKALDRAVALRDKFQSCDGCCFRAVISADYGNEVYLFSMNCQTDREGNLTFSVTEPSSILGITGIIQHDGGALSFDNQVLGFQAIADEQISPVMAPWILIKTIRSGYLNGCTKNEAGLLISIDDSYEKNSLHLNIQTGLDDLPVSCEIFWQGRRVMTVSVEDFCFL